MYLNYFTIAIFLLIIFIIISGKYSHQLKCLRPIYLKFPLKFQTRNHLTHFNIILKL